MFIERGKINDANEQKGRKKEYINPALSMLAFYILLFLLSACGSDVNISSGTNTSIPSAETGSINFYIEWQSTPIVTSNSLVPAQLALDCAATGISTLEAKVYDETNSILASGEWGCAAHSGTINNVKAGSNRTLVILGKDSQGDNIFIGGPLGGITLLPNQAYNAGIIQVIPYSITLVSPPNESSIVNCNFSFQWFGAPVSRFEIQIDERIDFSSPILSQILTANSYTPAHLNPGKYYWRVRAMDDLGNMSKWSEIWSCTVLFAIGQRPLAPGGVNAVGGDSQIIISWGAVSGAAAYNLYWSLFPDVSKVSYTEKISNVSSPFTHLGRINSTTYYYVLTAVNSCGESNESAEVSGIPGIPPSAPIGVIATAGNKQVTITWNNVIEAASYNIYWSTDPGVNKTNGIKITNIASPYIHTDRINHTTYYYVVTAVNIYGESIESSQVFARPP